MKRGIGFSLLLHGFFVVAYVLWSHFEQSSFLEKPVLHVHLAKLGKPRDESLLPRLDASETKAPEEVKEEVKAPAEKKIVKAPPSAQKKPQEPRQNPLELLKKRFGKPSDEGVEKGSASGNSLSQEFEDSYERQLGERIREAYELPEVISLEKRKRLKVTVRLVIGPVGNLIRAEVVSPSGEVRFDDAVIAGTKRIRSFGSPPLPLQRQLKTRGLELDFCPLRCLD